MDEMKYIIVEVNGCECPIIFSPILEHFQVGRCFGRIISGGFCTFQMDTEDNFHANVWGKSVTLNIANRPEDKNIIERMLNNDRS